MVIKNMDATDNWRTSTPLQCRHDSGYGSYLKHYYGVLELSPIRKSSDMQQEENKVRCLINSNKIHPRKLSFLNVFNGNSSESSENDSGIASGINESICENVRGKKTHCFKDENSNLTCLIDNAIGNEYQPSKYTCKDHSYEIVTSLSHGKCKRNPDASKVFKSYTFSSELFKSEKKRFKVDFLYELDIRNCTSIISDILSNLSDEDLRQVNNVSKKWQDIVSSDKNANNRRILYINNKKNAARGPDKENKLKTATPVERDHKSAFTSLVNVENESKQPLIFESIQGRFDSFVEESKTEGNQQILMKCPKCLYPARVETELKYCCTRKLCKHEFCKKCLGPFLDNHKCSISEVQSSVTITVGSKKSRKNLRRLKA